MANKMTPWSEIQEGYGFKKIPREFTNELCCQICNGNFPTPHLYTTQSLEYNSVASLQRMLDRVRQDCWCKFHAHRYFQPAEVK